MPYAELHAKSNFSFLEGASHPEELVARAAELRYAALAVTDRNSLAGVVRAHVAAKELGFKKVLADTDLNMRIAMVIFDEHGFKQTDQGHFELEFV